jgi:hypothetical protein
MVDHINIDLDDYDIEDYDRGLPAYIYDLSMLINANDLRGVSVSHMLIDRITRSSVVRKCTQEYGKGTEKDRS